jgi:carotenoid 1,2-hydratase
MPDPRFKQAETAGVGPEPDGNDADRAGGFRNPVSGEPGRAVRPGADRLAGQFRAAGGGDEIAGPVSGGRLGASGPGPADGGLVGPGGGALDFGRPVEAGGYEWWYVDAISDDGRHALTLIGFIGSVFSPYYAWANRKTPAPAENFCAFNIALYGPGAARWAMTERHAAALHRSADVLQIGPSHLRWTGTQLAARIIERGAPLPRRVRGGFTLTPTALQPQSFALDAAGHHRWRPIAPAARIEVAFTAPEVRWSGHAYFDTNAGDRPLAADFRRWDWSRTGRRLLYDMQMKDGTARNLALAVGADGGLTPFAAPAPYALPKTAWRLPRTTRSDAAARVETTLEDTPFYARSVISTVLGGEAATGVHESLSMSRFTNPVVQMMLPFRMPRV